MAKPSCWGGEAVRWGELGRIESRSPRWHSQGQEEVDPVVEVSRQPDAAKVLHHHGKQVLCGHRGQVRGKWGGSVLHGPWVLPHPTAVVGTPQGGLC